MKPTASHHLQAAPATAPPTTHISRIGHSASSSNSSADSMSVGLHRGAVTHSPFQWITEGSLKSSAGDATDKATFPQSVQQPTKLRAAKTCRSHSASCLPAD